MRNFPWVGFAIASVLFGCSSHQAGVVGPTRVARTSGSAVALSRDEQIAVLTNRSAGIVTVFSLTAEAGQTKAKIVADFDTGADSEPWASVISADDDVAYVLFRNAQVVRRVTHLHGTPVLERAGVAVGSEPTAIAITPSGSKLFVANWGEGTLSAILSEDFLNQVKVDIDLNPALVETGTLGDAGSRQGLAHPRALAISDNGDDNDLDETLYATEFFSQSLPGIVAASDQSDVDRNRQGFVYPIAMKTGQPGKAIAIAPVQATGFVDGEGRMTSCFPNQLNAAAVDHGRLYVTSMCTSPRGPLGPKTKAGAATDKNFKTLFHPAVFVIDTATNQEMPTQGRLLTQVLDGYYQAGEDATNERMPLTPDDLAFDSSDASGSKAYLSASGADALFRLDYDGAGILQEIGDPGARNIDVQSDHGLPTGVAVSKQSLPAFALVATDTKLRLSIIDRATEQVTSYVDVNTDTKLPRAASFRTDEANQGRAFFGTGRDNWSYQGQAWSSCEACHPGGLSDGVTWFFARGPRRTISIAGTYDKNPELGSRSGRMMLWGANIDEVHDVEAIVRGVSGGVGAVLWGYANESNNCRLLYDGSPQTSSAPMSGAVACPSSESTTNRQNGLNGALSSLETGTACEPGAAVCDTIPLLDWHMIDAFIRAQRAPRAPTELAQADIDAGRTLFHLGRCGGCHGGPDWTVSKLFYPPGADQNGSLPYLQPASLDRSALGALRTSTYQVADSLLALNPPALANKGLANFRNMALAGAMDSDLVHNAYANAQDDQIQCALRDVGTFPQPTASAPFPGITPPGAPGVFELRQDMTTLAQGAAGFNVPSLFGLAVGAPYFHAGNARTLEELFDSATFARHYQALAPTFLTDAAQRDQQIAELVAFLLSIDETSTSEGQLAADAGGNPLQLDFCQPSPP